ncbi:MAG TPA: hypothetical protein VKN36_08930 [Eudoraea sp.]|nr:hypothetical protein [Eudoraea sp.]
MSYRAYRNDVPIPNGKQGNVTVIEQRVYFPVGNDPNECPGGGLFWLLVNFLLLSPGPSVDKWKISLIFNQRINPQNAGYDSN